MTLLKLTRIVFFVFFWWSVSTPNFFNIYNVPVIIDIIDELLQLFLFVCWVMYELYSNKKIIINKYIKILGFVFVLVISISAFINKVSPFIVLQFSIIYLRPLLMILVSARIFSFKDIPCILKNLIVLIVIQLILNFTWLTGINPIDHYKIYIDISTGTFESVAPLAYFCIIIIFYLIAKKHIRKLSENKLVLFYIFLAIIVIQLFFTFTLHSIIFGGLASLGFVIINKKYIYYLGISFIILLSVLFLFSEWEKQRFHGTTAELIHPENLLDDRMERVEHSVKFLSLYLVLTNNVPEIKSPWLGAGPGLYGSIVAARHSDIYSKYHDTDKLKSVGVDIHDVTSVTGGASSGALAILGDIGWIGYIILLSINIKILLIVFKFINNKLHYYTKYPELFISFIPSLIFYMMLDVIWDLGNFKIMSIGLWVWAGILLKEIQTKCCTLKK